MKTYGKPDASWDDETFRSIVEGAMQMAMEHEEMFAVSQDDTCNVIVAKFTREDPCVYACWAGTPKNPWEGKVELTDNVMGKTYTTEQIIPRIRDVLTNGIVEYGNLRFMNDGLIQVKKAIHCARRLVVIHDEPFIMGLTDTGIMVAPMSAENRFIKHTSCVVTINECRSLRGRCQDTNAASQGLYEPYRREDEIASNMHSIRFTSAPGFIYRSILDHTEQKCECF